MIIKIRALERLRDVIACEVKELQGRICAGPGTRDHKLKFPHVALIPQKFSFLPHQADERDHVRDVDRDFGPMTAIFNVGTWQGTVQVRIGAKDPETRYRLEYYIEQTFLGNIDGTAPDARDIAGEGFLRPGVMLIDIPDCDDARCSFELEDDTWENEKVFTNEWYSIMNITANIPALVRAKGIPEIETLQLSLTQDLDTSVTSIAEADALLDIETVNVAEDGTISPP